MKDSGICFSINSLCWTDVMVFARFCFPDLFRNTFPFIYLFIDSLHITQANAKVALDQLCTVVNSPAKDDPAALYFIASNFNQANILLYTSGISSAPHVVLTLWSTATLPSNTPLLPPLPSLWPIWLSIEAAPASLQIDWSEKHQLIV